MSKHMTYKMVDDYKISIYEKIPYDTGYSSIPQVRVYDFLNMQTYIYSMHGDNRQPTTPQNISDLDSLEGARLAYEELKKQGGKPPEINFPEQHSRKTHRGSLSPLAGRNPGI